MDAVKEHTGTLHLGKAPVTLKPVAVPVDYRRNDLDPQTMLRGEFEAWERLRGRGQYDVVHDRMLFRLRSKVLRVEMPLRFQTQYVHGIVYALIDDIELNGKVL